MNLENLTFLALQKYESIILLDPSLPNTEFFNFYGIIFDVPTAFIELIFKIEDSFGVTAIDKDYAKEDIVIEKLIVKVSDDENQRFFMFNRVTNVLYRAGDSKKKDYIKSKEDLKKNYIKKGRTYTCIKTN